MVALAPGWIDTGVTRSFSVSGSIQPNGGGASYYWYNNRTDISFHGGIGANDLWHLWSYVRDEGSFPNHQWYGDIRLVHGIPFGGLDPATSGTLVETLDLGTGATPGETVFATPVGFTGTLGPYRLGATYEQDVPTSMDVPLFAEYHRLRYAWFADEETLWDETFGGENVVYYALTGTASPPASGVTPVAVAGWVARQYVQYAGTVSSAGTVAIKFRDYAVNGVDLDTDGIPHPVAAGDWDVKGAENSVMQFAPGGSLQMGCVVLDYAGNTLSANVRDNWLTQGSGTPSATWVPGTLTDYAVGWCTSWTRSEKSLPQYLELSLDSAWIAAGGWDPDDYAVNLDLFSPITGGATYAAISVAHAAALEVDRPAGGRPSHWTTGSGGSVTETGSDTTFTVTDPAGQFTRQFATNWRHYITPADPDYRSYGARILKRHYLGSGQTVYPEDVWWWNGYCFLKVTVDASDAATMTLVVDGVRLRTVGGDDQYAESRTYTVALTSGSHDYWLDLGFPQSFGTKSDAQFPLDRPRVDKLTLQFSAAGTFVLSALVLSRRDSYQPEIAITYTPVSHYNDDLGALYLRVDGEPTVTLSIPDSAFKGVQMEPGFGGAPRPWDPSSGGWTTRTVEELWTDIDRVEGFTVTYDEGAGDTYLGDTFGRRLGPEYGFWCVETAPGAAFTSGSIDLPHRIRAGRIAFPNGMADPVKVWGRKIIGAGLETVAMKDGARAPASVSLECRDEANALLGTVTTDSRGRAFFGPIGYNKQAQFVEAP